MAGRILVVEDDEFIRDVLATSLEDEGYDVDVAGSGRQVWQYLAEVTPHMVLLDLALPEEDGLSICRKLRLLPETAQVPVVFVSAMTQPMYLQAAAQAGGNGFIKKPFDIDHVIATVAHFLAVPAAVNPGSSLSPTRPR